MLRATPLVFDAFWRALVHCMHPRVIMLSLLPLAVLVLLVLVIGYFFWQPGLALVNEGLAASAMLQPAWGWLDRAGAGGLRSYIGPVLLMLAVTPLLALSALVSVGLLMAPALTALVARRRFPQLAQRHGASMAAALLYTVGATALGLLVLVLSMPLWLLPPLALVLPPLVWGWLTYRVMAFDALANHATQEERRLLMRRHRLPLLLMGLLCGYLGALPGIVWASGALFLAAFVLLAPLAVWLYALVFAFSSLWFTHFCLAALQAQRASAATLEHA